MSNTMSKKKTRKRVYKVKSHKVISDYYNSCPIIYLFVSKENWHDLEDRDGNKLLIPQTWYCGGAVDKWRISDHLSKKENLSAESISRSKIQQYMRENSLKINAKYYFDVYILDLTEFLWLFSKVESKFSFDRQEIIRFVHAMEYMIKRDLYHYFIDAYPPIIKFHTPDTFIVGGEPIIKRFNNIWGSTETCYLQYGIENIGNSANEELKAMQKMLFAFMRKLCASNFKHVLDDALTPLTLSQFQKAAKQRLEERKRRYKPSQIDEYLLMP